MKFRSKLAALAASTGLAIAGLSAAAPPAQAGALCDNSGICGDVTNNASSRTFIYAYNSWGSSGPAGSSQVVYPGQYSTFRDVDGFCLRPGYTASVTGITTTTVRVGSGGCLKVSDNQNARVTVN